MFRDKMPDRKNFSLKRHFPPQFVPFTWTSWYPAHLGDVRGCKHPLQFGVRHLSPRPETNGWNLQSEDINLAGHTVLLGIVATMSLTVPSLGTKHDKSAESTFMYKLYLYSHLQRTNANFGTSFNGNTRWPHWDARPDLTTWKFLLWCAAAASAPKPTAGKMNTDAGCRLSVFLPDSEWTPTCLSKAKGLL